jgi:hypothetical protein
MDIFYLILFSIIPALLFVAGIYTIYEFDIHTNDDGLLIRTSFSTIALFFIITSIFIEVNLIGEFS